MALDSDSIPVKPMPPQSGSAETLSDDELLRRYLGDEADDDGETFIAIYTRHRVAVRAELEAAGLPPQEAENRVGTVFIRALDQHPDSAELSLRDRLLVLAREVARDPERPPF
jgi:hypothetical protein